MKQFLTRQFDSVIASRDGTQTQSEQQRSESRRQRGPLVICGIALLTIGVVWFITTIVAHSLKGLTRDSMQSVLRVNASAVQLWLDDLSGEASVASLDSVRTPAVALLDEFGTQPELRLSTIAGSADFASLGTALESKSLSPGLIGWALIDAERRVIASSNESLVTQSLDFPADAWEQLVLGESTVSRPFRSPVPLVAEGSLSRSGCAVMAAAAPITNDRQTVGGLLLLVDPHARFSEIMTLGRQGETGEMYALDRDGWFISRSRFEPQLRAIGILGSDLTQTSILNVRLLAPGQTAEDDTPDTPNTTSTDTTGPSKGLTRLADQATRGGTGEDVEGYVGYRGDEVIGAWKWLPKYRMGIAYEISVAEAYRPMQILRTSFLIMLGLIVASVAAVLGIAALYRRLADRVKVADRTVRRLGQYELGELLGCGGMGSVYRGRHHLLRRDVAVKVLEGANLNVRSVSRFQREVQMTSLLRHPNTIDIYDYGRTENGTFFYVMEYVDGITLQQLVEYYGAQPPDRVIYLLLQVCGSLAEAHDQGIIHRDIKPANILLTAQAGLFDMIKVLDFGLVKDLASESLDITRVESLTGTPLYVAPESIRSAGASDSRSDIYSIGAVGYTLLTGRPTFEGETVVDICMKQLHGEPVRPSERLGQQLPDDLQNLLMSCLCRDSAERPPTMQVMCDMLRECENAFDWTASDAKQWWNDIFERPRGQLIDTGNQTLAGAAIKFPSDKTPGDNAF